ncbi:hypothetical protein NDU88_002690 [Pleurodeles waltl]|uniref:Uncharacterized protein n=1 Tax=Pleurodeles waltl TaxID=8319 RepID=A0AAV7MP36_PLEWA|nr:hypothetical protein NDU88_002690 [Pleurodeles waltl]
MDQQVRSEQPEEMEEILQRLQMSAEEHGKDKKWLDRKLDEDLQEDLASQQDDAHADTVGDTDWTPTNMDESPMPKRCQRRENKAPKIAISKTGFCGQICCLQPSRQWRFPRAMPAGRQQMLSISAKLYKNV